MKTPETDEIDTAPEQWRSQCLVARIQRDEAIKSADKARAYKRVLKEENARLRLELGKALKSLENVNVLAPAGEKTQPTNSDVYKPID